MLQTFVQFFVIFCRFQFRLVHCIMILYCLVVSFLHWSLYLSLLSAFCFLFSESVVFILCFLLKKVPRIAHGFISISMLNEAKNLFYLFYLTLHRTDHGTLCEVFLYERIYAKDGNGCNNNCCHLQRIRCYRHSIMCQCLCNRSYFLL